MEVESVGRAADLRIEHSLAVIIIHIAQNIALVLEHESFGFEFADNDLWIAEEQASARFSRRARRSVMINNCHTTAWLQAIE